jgi:twinfilin-like protein
LVATIKAETLVPLSTIPSTSSSFTSDLSNLQSHLKSNEALYILLRLDNSTAIGPSFTAITYVPDAAPVRQKMLFASTRLTLTRELGGENFTETLFCTLPEELSAEGWKKHEAHEKLENPLTEEERNLVGIKEAELTEMGGTGRRGAGYGGSSGLKMVGGEGVVEALSSLGDGGLVMLVSFAALLSEGRRNRANKGQQKIDASETMVLAEKPVSGVQTSELASHISSSEPRYSFYKHSFSGAGGQESATVFIYTCPTSSKVKDRMLYASSRRSAESLAEKEAGIKLAKKVRCIYGFPMNKKC